MSWEYNLRLYPRLVPATLFYRNLRNENKQRWLKEVTGPIVEAAKGLCEICQGLTLRPYGDGSLHCDEVWEYCDVRRMATLIDLRATCICCHSIIHIGHTMVTIRDERVVDKLVEFAAKVNGITVDAMRSCVNAAFAAWVGRSEFNDWRMDWAKWRPLADAALVRLKNRKPPTKPVPPERKRTRQEMAMDF